MKKIFYRCRTPSQKLRVPFTIHHGSAQKHSLETIRHVTRIKRQQWQAGSESPYQWF
jgi:hypothetical protein